MYTHTRRSPPRLGSDSSARSCGQVDFSSPLSLSAFLSLLLTLTPIGERRRWREVNLRRKMEVARASLLAVAMLALICTVFFPAAAAQSAAPAPAPTSDGTTIDQGVACVLMLVALALTYLIH